MNRQRIVLASVLLAVPALLLALAPPDMPKQEQKDFSKATAYKVSRVVDVRGRVRMRVRGHELLRVLTS